MGKPRHPIHFVHLLSNAYRTHTPTRSHTYPQPRMTFTRRISHVIETKDLFYVSASQSRCPLPHHERRIRCGGRTAGPRACGAYEAACCGVDITAQLQFLVELARSTSIRRGPLRFHRSLRLRSLIVPRPMSEPETNTNAVWMFGHVPHIRYFRRSAQLFGRLLSLGR